MTLNWNWHKMASLVVQIMYVCSLVVNRNKTYFV